MILRVSVQWFSMVLETLSNSRLRSLYILRSNLGEFFLPKAQHCIKQCAQSARARLYARACLLQFSAAWSPGKPSALALPTGTRALPKSKRAQFSALSCSKVARVRTEKVSRVFLTGLPDLTVFGDLWWFLREWLNFIVMVSIKWFRIILKVPNC